MVQAPDNSRSFQAYLWAHPPLLQSCHRILDEVENILAILGQETMDLKILVKINTGLVQDFELAMEQYPDMAEMFGDRYQELINRRELLGDEEYVYGNKQELIDHYRQLHQSLEQPILTMGENDDNADDDTYTTTIEAEWSDVSQQSVEQTLEQEPEDLGGYGNLMDLLDEDEDEDELDEAPEEEEIPRGNFVPQSICNDLAQGQDQLQIKEELKAIADILLLRQLEPPIAVGILGSWGSGKSFAMHLLQERINEIRCAKLESYEAWGDGLDPEDRDRDKKLSPYVGHVYQIKFNAWSYAKSNLWASLMQEIFAELNQQITFERQLRSIGVDLLEGGPLWLALEQLSEGNYEWFRNYLTPEQVAQLQHIENEQTVENVLLSTLTQTKETALAQVKSKQQELAQTQIALEQRRKHLICEEDSEQKLLLGASFHLLKQRIGRPFLDSLAQKLKAEVQNENLDLNLLQHFSRDVRGLITEALEQDRQKMAWTLFGQWSKRNWVILIIFAVLVTLCLAIPMAIAQLQAPDLITQITGILAPFLPTIATGQKLIESFGKWQEEAALALKESEAQLEANMKQQLAEDPALQELQAHITQLEQELAQTQQQLPKPDDTSLGEFLEERLKEDNYRHHLGLMHQVEQDLKNLSDRLLPLDRDQDPAIQELFPRGIPRVVLYIDDLDRCPPKRVVEVLETVQLLLKTQLFVVILAIDDRYIARSLEDVYARVLKRRAKPSGMDYLEKIIQIPYRMRPIAPKTIERYLRSQINLTNSNFVGINPTIQPSTLAISPSGSSMAFTRPNPTAQEADLNPSPTLNVLPPSESSQNLASGINLRKILEITPKELDLILNCCKYIDITPRTGKRLINIYKILKIIWQNTEEPGYNTKKIILAFLALSARYPDLMRYLFEEIDTELQEYIDIKEQPFELASLLDAIETQINPEDYYAQREWRKFASDIQRMVTETFELTKDHFHLILSFCFIGDIGYDPDDFA